MLHLEIMVCLVRTCNWYADKIPSTLNRHKYKTINILKGYNNIDRYTSISVLTQLDSVSFLN